MDEEKVIYIKKKDIFMCVTTWLNLEIIVLNGTSQSASQVPRGIMYMRHAEKEKILTHTDRQTDSRNVAARAWRRGKGEEVGEKVQTLTHKMSQVWESDVYHGDYRWSPCAV